MPPLVSAPLLNAIRDQPDDDVLRLAYADWLEENGDPDRAEFVRVQCRLAALGHGPLWPPTAGTPDRTPHGLAGESLTLVQRQTRLWAENWREWQGELPPLPGCTVLFHRGFAAEVVAEHPGGLVRDGATLFAAAPVTRVTFRGCRPEAVEVTLLRPWFDRVRGLTVSRPTGPAGAADRVVALLAGAKHLAGLESLSLFGVGVSNDGASRLAGAGFTGNLARLDLARNRIAGSGAADLGYALDPARLAVLDLSGNPLSDRSRAFLRGRFGERACLEEFED